MAVEIVLETSPVLGLPDWLSRAVVVLAFLGFPVTVVLAWAFDITPQGVVRTAALGPEGEEPAPAPVVVRAAPGRLAGVFGAGVLVALVGFGAYSAFTPTVAAIRPEAIQSVAVLPFSDLSAEQDQGYFADGVTEELIRRLARLGDIRVAARTSSFALRDENASLDEIARQLGVDAVIEGSVRREGDRLRVNVELVDAATGFQIWSEAYDRTASDIFAIQDDISTAIVEALRLELLPLSSRIRSGTASVRAHDYYLLGLARWHARTEADLRRALSYFEQAVREDDRFAPAHAGLALVYAVLPFYSDFPVADAAERGATAAARALALDAQLAEAHAAIGQIAQSLEWNLEAAEMAYRRALTFQPNYSTGRQWYGETLMMMGRLTEARREIEAAVASDPLSVAARGAVAYLSTVERRYEEARGAYHALLRDNPDYRLGQLDLMFLCLAAGCTDDAVTAARAAYPDSVASDLEIVIRDGREPDDGRATEALERLERFLPAGQLALLHAARGDVGAATDRVELAFEEGDDPTLLFNLVHPLLDPLRRDPRFRRVADAVGIEAPTARLPAP